MTWLERPVPKLCWYVAKCSCRLKSALYLLNWRNDHICWRYQTKRKLIQFSHIPQAGPLTADFWYSMILFSVGNSAGDGNISDTPPMILVHPSRKPSDSVVKECCFSCWATSYIVFPKIQLLIMIFPKQLPQLPQLPRDVPRERACNALLRSQRAHHVRESIGNQPRTRAVPYELAVGR